jgi:hypothetical protein
MSNRKAGSTRVDNGRLFAFPLCWSWFVQSKFTGERCSLFLGRNEGKSEIRKLTALQLGSLVQNTLLRFVYLSSCGGAHTASPPTLLDDDFLGVMDGLVMGGVPAVLDFRWPVSDDGAQLLTQSFYSAWLDEEKRLDKASCEARRTVADQLGRDERAWFSPILTMGSSPHLC